MIAGHRGAMGLEPENTMRAFRRAVELGVDEIELDVHLSADGELVVIHDTTLDRTTDGSGPVGERTVAELSRLDAGDGERIPMLRDVLNGFPAVALQLEVKAPAAADAVATFLSGREDAERVCVTSFRPEALEAADRPGRVWRSGLIVGPSTIAEVEYLDLAGLDRVLPHWEVLGHPAIAAIAPARLTVWPCNDDATIGAAGVFGGLTTDRPDRALAYWRERSRLAPESSGTSAS